MNWSYIAGFTDGEGCIAFGDSSATFAITVALAQSGTDGMELLEEIQTFLKRQDIRSAIRRHNQKKTLGKKPMYQLQMGQRNSVQKVLGTCYTIFENQESEGSRRSTDIQAISIDATNRWMGDTT